MPFYDRTIDGIVIIHPHLDLLDNYKIGFEMDSGNDNLESKGFDIYARKLEEEKAKQIFAKRGMRINLDEGLYLDILLPVINKKGMSAHDEMVVARLVYGNNSFCLP